uniref:Chromate transporter n=1 Tax=Guillardia theta (strain CCMP2712) TaxID=905079 RepID=A0A0C3SSE1_GUITC
MQGWTAFGGPAAHIALFQKIFIERLNWMSHSLFMELFALGQCLPGPTSTQVSFAIGVVKKGILGGLLSGMLFQYPGLLMMSVIGYAADQVDWQNGALKGFASGLGAVGVALVAGAALTLSQKTCPDRETRILNLIAAVLAYMFSSAWIFPSLIAFGGLVTLIRERTRRLEGGGRREERGDVTDRQVTGAILLIVWISVLVIAIVLRTSVIKYEGSGRVLWWFESFYRTGSIIFGGGQVVLPLLVQEVVHNPNVQSWMTEEQFLAGLGIAQAMPGPLFNIAAYLGALTASQAGVNAIVGVCATWFGLFGPGVLVIFGTLPFWGVFRKQPVYRRALPGMNAAAVGLIVAAVFSLYDKV